MRSVSPTETDAGAVARAAKFIPSKYESVRIASSTRKRCPDGRRAISAYVGEPAGPQGTVDPLPDRVEFRRPADPWQVGRAVTVRPRVGGDGEPPRPVAATGGAGAVRAGWGTAGRARVSPRRTDGRPVQEAVQEPTTGVDVLPFVLTVNPKDVEAPAARFPL
ncbi:hypothetical protein EES45_32855 [Streptomyces sp. ADI97-07]|nr:hypothetical protein EES45_32855 [Streptomyces sp. ADI97-07]